MTTAYHLGALACLLTCPLALANGQEPVPAGASACQAIALTLPPKGTALPIKPMVEVIAGLPGFVLQLAPKAPKGLTLTYA